MTRTGEVWGILLYLGALIFACSETGQRLIDAARKRAREWTDQ